MSVAINYFLDEFKDYLKFQKGYADNTIKGYLSDLKILFKFENDLNNIDNSKVQSLMMLQNSKGLSPKSIKRLASSIKQYLSFLFDFKYIKKEATVSVVTPKISKVLPKVLSYESVIAMINSCSGINELRDKAIVATLYACGLRVSELVNIDINDIDFKAKFIKVTGKGNIERLIPIGKIGLSFLSNYLDNRNIDSQIVFINKNANRLTIRSVQNIIPHLANLAGVDFAVTPHMLRHAAASHLLQSSGDLRSVQEFLGHKSIVSTQVYTHLDYMQLAKVYDKYHPHSSE